MMSDNNNINPQQMKLENEYIKTFSKKENKAYDIAKSHLGMSFDMDKSIGFTEWKQKNK